MKHMIAEQLASLWVAAKSIGGLVLGVISTTVGGGIAAAAGINEATTVPLGLVFAICGSLVGAAVTVILVAVWLEHRFTSLEKGQEAINERLDSLPCDRVDCPPGRKKR